MNQPETPTAEAVIAPSESRSSVDQILEAHLQDHLREDPRMESTLVQLQNQVAALRDEVEHWRHRTERGRLLVWLSIGLTAMLALVGLFAGLGLL